jgi:hypothetical protein
LPWNATYFQASAVAGAKAMARETAVIVFIIVFISSNTRLWSYDKSRL